MRTETKRILQIGGALLFLYLCIHYWEAFIGICSLLLSAASPLIMGGVIAYLINILMFCYEKHYFPKTKNKLLQKSRRIVCMTGAIVSLIAIIALVIGLILPQLWECIQLLVSEAPAYLQKAVIFIEKLDILPEKIFGVLEGIDWKSRIGEIIGALTSGVGSVVDIAVSVVSSVLSGAINALLALIFAIYLLLSKETIQRQCKKVAQHYICPHWYEKILHILQVTDDCFHKYIVGQCTEAVILGLLCTIGMLILRLPYATMVGAFIAFTALIPIAGAYIGAFVGAFMIMTVSPMQALFFLVYLVVLQQLEGNIIYPRVVGSSIGLPGLWVLAAITVGGGVMGVFGMLIGVPLAAVAYRLLREQVNQPEPTSQTTVAAVVVKEPLPPPQPAEKQTATSSPAPAKKRRKK